LPNIKIHEESLGYRWIKIDEMSERSSD